MEKADAIVGLPFWKGAGEMGSLARSFKWSDTPIGSADTWPQSLKTTLGIIFHSALPMLLFWGKDLTCFYNDAFRVGNGNAGVHPEAGKNGFELRDDIRGLMEPVLQGVMATGAPLYLEDQPTPFSHSGLKEESYGTFSYSPAFGDDGQIAGVLVTFTDTTASVNTIRRLEEGKDRLHFAIEASELATWELNPITNQFTASARLREWFGLPAEGAVEHRDVIAAIPEPDRQRVADAIAYALQWESGGHYEVEHSIIQPHTGEKRIVKAKGLTRFDEHQQACYFNGTIQDVTSEIKATRALKESEQRFQNLVREATVGIIVLMGEEMNTGVVNESYARLIGRTVEELQGKDLFTIIPETEAYFRPIIDRVRTTGDPLYLYGTPYTVLVDGINKDGFLNLIYQPYKEDDGTITGVMVLCQDVTEQVAARRRTEASEAQLRTLIQSAPAAIGMFVGHELIIENPNQTFIDIVACGAGIEGRSLKELMPEQEHFLQALQQVLDTGKAYVAFGEKLLIMREGVQIERYFNLSFSPMLDEAGEVYAVLDVSIDITEQIIAQQKLEESAAQIRSMVESAPFPIGVYTGREMRIMLANQAIMDVYGKGNDVVGKLYTDVLPELANQEIFDQLRAVYDTGIAFHSGTRQVDLDHNGVLKSYYFNYSFTPLFDPAGQVYGIMNTAADVTVLETARIRAELAETRLRSVIAAAPAGIGLFVGRDLIIENPNQTFIDIVGKGASIAGLPLRDAMPELLTEGQPFLKILDEIFDTGKPFNSPASLVKIVQHGVLTDNYYNISYTPLFDAAGEVFAILDIAIDVTPQIKAQQQLQESELFARSIIDNSPVAKVVFTGPDMVISIANQNMLEILGRDEKIIGMPVMEAVPELKDTPLLEPLTRVYTTGETYHQPEERVELVKDGELQAGYYNYIYKAMYNTAGEIYGIVTTATDVTDQVTVRQKLEEAEQNLRGAIELAQLGTWSIDAATKALTYSDRLIEWFGYDPAEENYTEVIPIIKEEDRERIAKAVARAMDPESGGIYDESYTVIHPRTGQKRILHAQGKTIFDTDGKPIRINGTAQDITIQQELLLALESQVQQRTEELAATNEELAATNEELQATNEELATTNEELAEANTSLTHSNEELAQYAYVASHDLQEPLRKIRVFSGILSSHQTLNIVDRELVDKISGAAARMSLLINDLLEFSRLLKSETLMRPVDLNEVLHAVSDDFELIIKERNARIEISELPVIEAVGLQMNQLFYNLLSNSLKFIAPDVQPHITVTVNALPMEQLVKYIMKPVTFTTYYEVIFTDNGIGFESKYAEQIFEVFKRLHGRDHYPGSGIGLALCRRIVANHGGHLYAASTPGKGTVFHIILPAKHTETSWTMPGNYNLTPQ